MTVKNLAVCRWKIYSQIPHIDIELFDKDNNKIEFYFCDRALANTFYNALMGAKENTGLSTYDLHYDVAEREFDAATNKLQEDK